MRREQVHLAEMRLLFEARRRIGSSATPRVPLRRLATRVVTGSTPSEAAVHHDLVPWYTPASITGQTSLGEPVRFVARSDPKTSIFPPGSVLLVAIGATAGRVAYLDHEASGNQQLLSIACGDSLRPRYLLWHLYSRRDELRGVAPSATLPILTQEFVKNLLIPAKPTCEQDADLSCLDALAAALDEFEHQCVRDARLLDERKRALITAAVTGEFDVTTAGPRAAEQ